MTVYEIITIAISSMALIISIISMVFSKINMNKTEKIYYGQSELAISESITNAKNRVTDILANASEQNNQYTNQCMKVAIEQLLNSYEEACAKYIDSKVDKKRFKKTYFDEIKNIVESVELNEYFKFGSKYDAIKMVYEEWFNLEKR